MGRGGGGVAGKDQVGLTCTGPGRRRWCLDQGDGCGGEREQLYYGGCTSKSGWETGWNNEEKRSLKDDSSLGCHCQRINVQEGTKIKSSVLLLILRCWTTKWRCQVGRGIEGAHRKGQVLVVNIRVISNIWHREKAWIGQRARNQANAEKSDSKGRCLQRRHLLWVFSGSRWAHGIPGGFQR